MADSGVSSMHDGKGEEEEIKQTKYSNFRFVFLMCFYHDRNNKNAKMISSRKKEKRKLKSFLFEKIENIINSFSGY